MCADAPTQHAMHRCRPDVEAPDRLGNDDATDAEGETKQAGCPTYSVVSANARADLLSWSAHPELFERILACGLGFLVRDRLCLDRPWGPLHSLSFWSRGAIFFFQHTPGPGRTTTRSPRACRECLAVDGDG